MIQLLRNMKISVKHPVIVRVDNKGAIFIVSSITMTTNTKCMDIRYKYVNENVEDRSVKIIFIKSAKKNSNILTKNSSAELHKKHSKKRIGEKLNVFLFFETYFKLKGRAH